MHNDLSPLLLPPLPPPSSLSTLSSPPLSLSILSLLSFSLFLFLLLFRVPPILRRGSLGRDSHPKHITRAALVLYHLLATNHQCALRTGRRRKRILLNLFPQQRPSVRVVFKFWSAFERALSVFNYRARNISDELSYYYKIISRFLSLLEIFQDFPDTTKILIRIEYKSYNFYCILSIQ